MAVEPSALRRPPDDEAGGATVVTGIDVHPETDALSLDRLIHERVRLGIVSCLAVNGSLTFTDLRDLLGTTDGNLSAHARRLEEAGYLICSKSHDGRTSKTVYALTRTGHRELRAYLDHMEAIIEATRRDTESSV